MLLRSRGFRFLVFLGVIFFGPVLVYGLFATWWGRYSFRPDDSEAYRSVINQTQEGFFSLKYAAYKERHNFGGTLNRVSIRNLAKEPLTVESLALEQVFRGRQVTDEDAPIPYDGSDGSFRAGNYPTTLRAIEPGETMTFEFPTKAIWACAEGDRLQVTLTVVLRAGAQRYERRAEFGKTLVKPQPYPL